jgi:phosphoribosylglycinamide formyltransferase-1
MCVVMLAGRGASTWMVANALKDEVPLPAVIVEEPVGRWQAVRRRAAKLGWWTAFGQVLFSLYARGIEAKARERRAEIMREYGLDARRPEGVEVLEVRSANDDSTIELLRRLGGRVVVANGTRILSKRVLESVDAVFLNMHVGITPKYRGVHGGYWALANRDPENAGVTVHLVNPGIDTGGILYQARIQPTERDSFATYPLLQLAAGLPLLRRAVQDALDGEVRPVPAESPSRLYYLPTLWQYWLRGVK